MKQFRKAFTMIELVFVIVVLGILAAIAVPKLAATRTDAILAKGKANVLAIRSGIVTERQSRMFRGQTSYAPQLDGAAANASGVSLFNDNGLAAPYSGSVLQSPVTSGTKDGHWIKRSNTTYAFIIKGADNIFTYDSTAGTFTCTSGTYCSSFSN